MRSALLLMCIFCCSASAECRKPDIEAIMTQMKMDRDYIESIMGQLTINDSVHVLETESGSETIQWVTVDWEGPVGGFVAALNCRGELVGSAETGGTLTFGPMTIEGLEAPALKVEYVAGTGTSGYEYDEVGVFAVIEGKFTELWRHALKYSGFQMCECSDNSSYDVRVSTDGLRIQATGSQTTTYGEYRGDECVIVKEETAELPKASLCWNGKNSYVECAQ